MKLRVYPSDQGDCLLLTASDATRILCDGGMRSSYRENVAPELAVLREAGEKLNLVYVSHVDQDHISGILELLDTELAWRVHEFQIDSGNTTHAEPDQPRPPEIGEIWHNGFGVQIDGDEPIAELLAQGAGVLCAASEAKLIDAGAAQRQLATSIREGIELSARIGADQLGIPLNRAFDAKLALRRAEQGPIQLGSLEITVLGPSVEDLEELREEWSEWLTENRAALERLKEQMREDAGLLAAGELTGFDRALAQRAAELGDRSNVTTPNLASLMLLVTEQGHSALLTGDGHATDILAGLDAAGCLDDEGGIHVDLLKVQHHGSEHNIDAEFCRRVSADHYVFCGNGSHHNPDLRALEAIIDSRIGAEVTRTKNPGSERAFELTFNASSESAPAGDRAEHMKDVEELVAAAAGRSSGRLSFVFATAEPPEIQF